MPYGVAYFAAGYEVRNQGYYERPDPLVAGGLSSTNFQEATRGKTGSEEFFIEMNFPLLNGVVGAQELEMTLSARSSEFTSGGIVGRVERVIDNEKVEVLISDNVKVEIVKATG